MQDIKRFLHVQNINKNQRLVLPSTFNTKGQIFLEIAFTEPHAASAHKGIDKSIQALTDKFEYQSFSQVVKESVGSWNICERTKDLKRGPIGYVIPLHVLVRQESDIIMYFLKL